MNRDLDLSMLEAAIRQLPAAVVIAEAGSGRLLFANEHVVKVWRQAQLPSASVAEYREWQGFHADGRPYEPQDWPMARAVRGERIEGEDIHVVRGDGTRGIIRVSAAPVTGADGERLAAVVTFHDVTPERREQDALALLAEAGEIAGNALAREETLRRIAEMSVPKFADLAFVHLLAADGTIVRQEAAAVNAELEAKIRHGWATQQVYDAPLRQVIESGQPSLVAEVTDDVWTGTTDEIQRRSLVAMAIRSAISVPIRGAGRTYGVMSFARTMTSRPYEQFDVLIAEELARRAAQAMERSAFFEAERAQRIRAEQSTTRVEHLQAMTATLSTAVTTDEVCKAVINEMRDLIGAAVVAVGLVDDGHQFLHFVASAGLPEHLRLRYLTLPLDSEMPVARAAATGQAIWLHSAAEMSRQSNMLSNIETETPNRAWAAVPLAVPGRIIGSLGISFREEQEFPPETRDFVLSIARQGAQALERARLFDSERAARQEAEEASRAKDEFLAILSHELRTPLTTVIGWADLLKLTYDGRDPAITHAIGALRASAGIQARLIDDLLDVSRIVAGKLSINRRNIDLTAVVKSATEALRLSAETKKIQLAFHGDGPTAIQADASRVHQIVTNLVANAIKFTPEGGKVDVRVTNNDSEAELVVQDSGVGIAADFLPHVFERFRQASSGDSRSYTGLGLGLSIVQSVVQLHGGSVRAESEGVGRGATFTVTLPLSQG
jgi:signal transduction histidine kinase